MKRDEFHRTEISLARSITASGRAQAVVTLKRPGKQGEHELRASPPEYSHLSAQVVRKDGGSGEMASAGGGVVSLGRPWKTKDRPPGPAPRGPEGVIRS